MTKNSTPQIEVHYGPIGHRLDLVLRELYLLLYPFDLRRGTLVILAHSDRTFRSICLYTGSI